MPSTQAASATSWWQPRHNLEQGLRATVTWYLEHQPWCASVRERARYDGSRLDTLKR